MRGTLAFTLIWILLAINTHQAIGAPESEGEGDGSQPPLKLQRAEENYRYLRDIPANKRSLEDAFKLISLGSEDFFLTLGGEYRARYQLFRNEEWSAEPDEKFGFYSHRIAGHVAAQLGPKLRMFGELYHGRQVGSGTRPQPTQDDDLAVHQLFAEGTLSSDKLRFRIGRQELGFGSTRLVGIREGPNMRRSFDAFIARYHGDSFQVDVFGGTEAPAKPGIFDNNSFENPVALWGIYGTLDLQAGRKLDLFYLGFSADGAVYDTAAGNEIRHSVGVRSYGTLSDNRFRYNTEAVVQAGTLDSSDIFSFAINTDWRWNFQDEWESKVGVNADYIRGDHDPQDGKLETFNPLFNNPSYLGLMGVIAPTNLINIHPYLLTSPSEGVTLKADVDFYFRESTVDGVYRPPRFVQRPTLVGATSRYIGTEVSITGDVEVNHNVRIAVDLAYFVAGTYLEQSGEAENIVHFALTSSFRF